MNKRLVWNFEISDTTFLQLPQGPCNTDQNVHFETRFFWPEESIVCLNSLDENFLDLSNYKIKQRDDIYCLLENTDFNLKRRNKKLLYKPQLKKTKRSVAFGKKINLNEEIDHLIFTGNSNINVNTLLQHIDEKGLEVVVKKTALIYKFATTPSIKLELTRLSVANTIYFSMGIESRAQDYVESLAHQLIGELPSTDYVTFLKTITKP